MAARRCVWSFVRPLGYNKGLRGPDVRHLTVLVGRRQLHTRCVQLVKPLNERVVGGHLKHIHQIVTLLGGFGVLHEGENPKSISKEEWKKRLTADQFYITRQKGTEPRFLEKDFVTKKEEGNYCCVCCGAELFSSSSKFDSGSGWPSFHSSLDSNVARKSDVSLGMSRTEVTCAKCDGHLGHVFPDGPKPTGERHCINSIAVNFEPKKTSSK